MSNTRLGDLIGRGEGTYGSFNRGRAGDSMGKQMDFSQITVAEVMRLQRLPSSDPNKLTAVGKYQMIPDVLEETVSALGIDPNAKLTPELQEQMFTGHLINGKRPAIRDYITGKSNDIEAAATELSKEWAAIADPATGKSRYDKTANNSSSITADEARAALMTERALCQEQMAAGKSAQEALRSLTIEPYTQGHEQTQGREQTLESPGMAAILEQNPAPVMRRGHSNEGNVRELQTLLTANGYDVDGVDGKFGAKTETALRAFQEKSGLGVDGVYGNKTQEALRGIEQARQAALAAQKNDPTQEAGIADPTLQGQTPEAGADGGLTPEAPPKEQVQGEVPAEGERDRVAEFKESFLHTMGIYSEMTPEERDRANIEVQQAMQTGIDAGNKQKEQEAQEQGGVAGPGKGEEGGVVAGGEGGGKPAEEASKDPGLADYLFAGLSIAAYGMQAFGKRDLSMAGLFLDRAVDVLSRVIGINDRTQEAIEREHTDIGQARQDYPSKNPAKEAAETEKPEPTAEVSAASARTADGKVPTSLTIDGKEHDISSFKMAPGATVAKNADGTMLASYDKDADRLDIFHRSSSSKGPVTSIEDFSKQTAISYSGQSQEQGQQGRSQDMTAAR